MYFPSSSFGLFGGEMQVEFYRPTRKLHVIHSNTCSECVRFKPMAQTKCDKRHGVASDTFACKQFKPRSKNGFR